MTSLSERLEAARTRSDGAAAPIDELPVELGVRDSRVRDDEAAQRASDALAEFRERAIATLPPGARAVFVLHDVEGYKHEEIAEMHGSAVGTSKAQLHRARRLLREALGR